MATSPWLRRAIEMWGFELSPWLEIKHVASGSPAGRAGLGEYNSAMLTHIDHHSVVATEESVAALMKKHQPNAVIFQGPSSAANLVRWVGTEEGTATPKED